MDVNLRRDVGESTMPCPVQNTPEPVPVWLTPSRPRKYNEGILRPSLFLSSTRINIPVKNIQ